MLRPTTKTLLRITGALMVAAGLCGPVQASASEPSLLPPPKVGLVGISFGGRTVPDAPFRSTSSKLGDPMASHGLVMPTVFLPFQYRVDEDWLVVVEGGFGLDRYALADGASLGLTTITLQVGAQRVFDLGLPRLEPFAELGVGYYLSTFTLSGGSADPRSEEAHTTGGFAGAGLRFALTSDVGLVLEDRYAFAIVGLAGLGDTSVGGNTAALGLYYVWREDGH